MWGDVCAVNDKSFFFIGSSSDSVFLGDPINGAHESGALAVADTRPIAPDTANIEVWDHMTGSGTRFETRGQSFA